MRKSTAFGPLRKVLVITPSSSARVTPMPATPERIPSGRPIRLITPASKKTELRIWRELAPTQESMPNSLDRSLTEMAKAL